MILGLTHPALALAADLIQTLPDQITTSIADRDGYEVEVFNVTIQQHPLTGTLTISLRPGSPLESPTHFDTIQTVAHRHGATFVIPPQVEIGLPFTGSPPKPKRPKAKPKAAHDQPTT